MIIDCISDLHGYEPKLEGGDLLIVAGDLTGSDQEVQYISFCEWLMKQKYKKMIFIAGNHDNLLQNDPGLIKTYIATKSNKYEYLCDSGTEFEGLKIWGSPWTKTFLGMNPHCKAFTLETEAGMAEKFALIPHDTDILVTHSPPYGKLDWFYEWGDEDKKIHVGSKSLPMHYSWDGPLRLHVFGHIHEAYGEEKNDDGDSSWHYVNASVVNREYECVNKPIRVVL